jgi:deazaflavin-dependent oxidoreductase (nitroreductase family)
MTSFQDFNTQLIEEFRANGGKVGGRFADRPLLLLTTTGAKSGQLRTSPLVYTTDGDAYIIIASKGGAPTHPDWFRNLSAHPVVGVEVGSEQFQAHAEIPTGAEHELLYSQMAAQMPFFAEYQRNTERKIPVVVLRRIAK